MVTCGDFAGWLEDQLRGCETPSGAAAWRVTGVLVTAEAAVACGLRVRARQRVRLAGAEVPLNVLRAAGPDVWVELASFGQPAGDSLLIHLHLTLALAEVESVVYSAMRAEGYVPFEARLAAVAVASPGNLSRPGL